ncbi:hypothetical protein VC273_12785 [Xanthomonas nasturtii]|uniref:hypothetical protein n=1 Tax=Xanthomonas TaxID=338 RepID=UPI000E1E9E60|nr:MULTISPECIES: hypothetical protein [Xanthomonas]MEA9556753.1 hypothetical protein [Xanthomonas nasturtii]
MYELEVNKFYYTITFLDNELRIPVIQTLKYLGEKSNSEKESILLFNSIDAMQGEKPVFIAREHVHSLVTDSEGLLEILRLSISGELPSKGLPDQSNFNL